MIRWGRTFSSTRALYPSSQTVTSRGWTAIPMAPSLQGWKGALYFSRDKRRCSKITSPLSCLNPIPCNPRILLPLHQRSWISHEQFPNNPLSWATLPRLSRERIHAPGNGRCRLGNDFINTQVTVLVKISFKNKRLYSKGNSSPQRNSEQLTLRMLDGCTNYPF